VKNWQDNFKMVLLNLILIRKKSIILNACFALIIIAIMMNQLEKYLINRN